MNISRPSIGQFLLSTGDIVIAQMIEQDENSFTLNYAVTVNELDDLDYDDLEVIEGRNYYVMKPFISYTENLETHCAVNPISVVCLCTPADSLIDQYLTSCKTIQEALGNGEPVPKTPLENNVVTFKPKD